MGDAYDFVPFMEGVRMIIRMRPRPWPREAMAEARRELIEALISGLIKSVGEFEISSHQVFLISPSDWMSRRPAMLNGEFQLIPRVPSQRRYPIDRITNIEVNAVGIRREFAASGGGNHQPTTPRAKKRLAIEQAIASLGRKNLAPLLQKEREQTIIDTVAERRITVSPRLVRNVWLGVGTDTLPKSA